MLEDNLNRRTVLKTVGAGIISSPFIGNVSASQDLETYEVLLKGDLDSPITMNEIKDAQEDSLLKKVEKSTDAADIGNIVVDNDEIVVSYSHTTGNNGTPEIYVGTISENNGRKKGDNKGNGGNNKGKPASKGQKTNDFEVTSQSIQENEIKRRHDRAERHLATFQVQSTDDFVDYNEEWSRRFHQTYDSGSCPNGSMTTVLQSYERTDISIDNRALVTRALTYPGENECDSNMLMDELDLTHDWNDNDWGVSNPDIVDRAAEPGGGEESSDIGFSLGPADFSIPTSGPDTERKDNSTSTSADYNYDFGEDQFHSATHTTASYVEWDNLPGSSQYVSASALAQVFTCRAILPIFGCSGSTNEDSFGTTINLSTA